MGRIIIWESTQKARKEHFCDFCCNWIQPGEIYERRVWVPRGSILVLREHVHPSCPPNEIEEMMDQEEHAAVRTRIALVIRTKEVVLLQRNGEPVIRQETEISSVTITEAEEESGKPEDYEETPF